MQISDDLNEVMSNPFVFSCEKETSEVADEMGLRREMHDVFIFTLVNGCKVRKGDWIVIDVCDHWSVFHDEDYQNHKNDEINEE